MPIKAKVQEKAKEKVKVKAKEKVKEVIAEQIKRIRTKLIQLVNSVGSITNTAKHARLRTLSGGEFFVKWRYSSSEVTDGACGSAAGGDANCNAARG